LMPLDKADWPAGMKNADYGDWYAVRWGETAERSGAYGIMLSDFSDSQPVMPSYEIGFNRQTIARFQARIGRDIPGNDIPAKASHINAHYYPQWNDFLAQGYANFYARMANRLGTAGHPGLII